MKACFGNKIGFAFDKRFPADKIYDYSYGSFVIEAACELDDAVLLGETTMDYSVKIGIEKIDLNEIQKVYENKLEPVFACNIKTPEKAVNAYSFTAKTRISPKIGIKKPKVLIPVSPERTANTIQQGRLLTPAQIPKLW